jgi:hypothetical protein
MSMNAIAYFLRAAGAAVHRARDRNSVVLRVTAVAQRAPGGARRSALGAAASVAAIGLCSGCFDDKSAGQGGSGSSNDAAVASDIAQGEAESGTPSGNDSAPSSTPGGSGSGSGGGSPGASGSSGAGGSSSSGMASPSGSDASVSPSPGGCGITWADASAGGLAPPAAGAGTQFATTPESVDAGQVAGYCEYQSVSTATNIVGFESSLTPGVDEVVVFLAAGTTPPVGTLQACPGIAGTPIYIAPSSTRIETFTMPAGVGLPVTSGQHLGIFERLVNTGSSALSPSAQVNVLYAPDSSLQYRAAVMDAFNRNIDVPPGVPGPDGGILPGTQTVSGTCTAPAGLQFFAMTTLTFSHATAASISLASGGSSMELVHTGSEASYPADQLAGTGADWLHPGFGLLCPPLKLAAGDSFTYSCSYANFGNTAVAIGDSITNDQCNAIGYYYPVGNMPSCN